MQANATGLSNAFSNVTVITELAVDTVVGAGFEAESEKSVPVLRKVLIVLLLLIVTKSGALSQFRSFFPARPRMPLAFRKLLRFSSLLYTLRGDCFLCSRRKALNLRRSLRSAFLPFSWAAMALL